MKLSKKTASTFVLLVVLWGIIGTLSWEVLERAAGLLGASIDLSVGPVGFDAYVLSVSLMFNPGSLLGVIIGHRVFSRI